MSSRKLNWQNDECYICFDPFTGSDAVPRVVLYNCLHSICNECMELYRKHDPKKHQTCQFCKTAKYSSNALTCGQMAIVGLPDNTKMWRFLDPIYDVKSRENMFVDELQKTLLKLTNEVPREKLVPSYNKFFNTAMNLKNKIYLSKEIKYGQGKNTKKSGKLKVRKSSKLFLEKMEIKNIIYKNYK